MCLGSVVETRLLTEVVSDFPAAAIPAADTQGLALILYTTTPGQLQGFQEHNDIMDVLAKACVIIDLCLLLPLISLEILCNATRRSELQE